MPKIQRQITYDQIDVYRKHLQLIAVYAKKKNSNVTYGTIHNRHGDTLQKDLKEELSQFDTTDTLQYYTYDKGNRKLVESIVKSLQRDYPDPDKLPSEWKINRYLTDYDLASTANVKKLTASLKPVDAETYNNIFNSTPPRNNTGTPPKAKTPRKKNVNGI